MYRSKTTFWAPGNRLIREGDVLPDGDEVLEGRDDLFDPVVLTQVDESKRRRPGRPRKDEAPKAETSAKTDEKPTGEENPK